MDFNEHYPDQVIVLEHPYSDYAFNNKTQEANEVIKVADGPFAGKTGYLVRLRRERRLVFQMENMAVSIPDVWDYHLVRLHNKHSDRQTKHTEKARAIDLIVGKMQGCGFQDNLGKAFAWVMETLTKTPSFNNLIKQIEAEHPKDETYLRFKDCIKSLTTHEASSILSLSAYANENPGIANSCFNMDLRPFMTPTSGIPTIKGKNFSILKHKKFTEYILPITFGEETYYPKVEKARTTMVSYYAHIGIIKKRNDKIVVFVNWDSILREYFYLVGEAKAKQLESFSQFTPLLYHILMGQTTIKVEKNLSLDNSSIHALSITVEQAEKSTSLWEQQTVSDAIATLATTCQKICLEINSSTHLAAWRKYLRGIWLHV